MSRTANRRRPTITSRTPPTTWQADDWLALTFAQHVYSGKGTAASGQVLPVASVTRILQEHKLLGHAKDRFDVLPLDDQGREGLHRYMTAQHFGIMQRVHYAGLVRDALDGAGIPAVFFKGAVMSQVIWGDPSARSIGDVDVMVPADSLKEAVDTLRAAGCRLPAETADLRPRRIDRLAIHGLMLRLGDSEVDVHYRLDQISSVLPLTFDEVYARSREVQVLDQRLRTPDDELTLALLAVNGGRDLWDIWGRVLDFATMARKVEAPVDKTDAWGLGHRLEVGLAMSELLGAPSHPGVSPKARRLAAELVVRHAHGVPANPVRARLRQWDDGMWKARSVPSRDAYRWAALQTVWLGDRPGRGADDGVAEDVALTVRRLLRVAARPNLEPPEHLSDLVDGALTGGLDTLAFRRLERTMSADALGGQELAVLQLLAPLMAEQLPDHFFTGRAAGMRRRARVTNALTQALLARAQERTSDGVLLGDLAAARRFYPEPEDRRVLGSTWVVPGIARREAWRAARASTDDVVSVAGWPVLERHGVRLGIHRSLSLPFDVPSVGRAIDDSAEWLMYDSLVRCGLGAPAIQWYADAMYGQDLLDWRRVWQIAGIAGWYDPVAQACAVLRARHGWDVPLRLGTDRIVDSGYFSRSPVRPVRLSWLAVRLASRRR